MILTIRRAGILMLILLCSNSCKKRTSNLKAGWDDNPFSIKAIELQHSAKINTATFSKDGRSVITASDDRSAIIWNTKDGSRIHTLKEDAQFDSASFSPKGDKVITTHGRYSKMWHIGDVLSSFEFGKKSTQLSNAYFSDHGNRVLIQGYQDTTIWDADTGSPLEKINSMLQDKRMVLPDPNFQRMVIAGPQHVALWYIIDRQFHLKMKLPSINNITWGALSQESHVALLQSTEHGYRYHFSVVNIFPHLRTSIIRHASMTRGGALSIDGSKMATMSSDGIARVWNTLDGTLSLILEGHTAEVTSVEFSRDGKLLLTASTDKSAKIWRIQDGALLHTLTGHTEPLVSASFSRDGERILTVSKDNTARIWSLGDSDDIRDQLLQITNLQEAINFGIKAFGYVDDDEIAGILTSLYLTKFAEGNIPQFVLPNRNGDGDLPTFLAPMLDLHRTINQLTFLREVLSELPGDMKPINPDHTGLNNFIPNLLEDIDFLLNDKSHLTTWAMRFGQNCEKGECSICLDEEQQCTAICKNDQHAACTECLQDGLHTSLSEVTPRLNFCSTAQECDYSYRLRDLIAASFNSATISRWISVSLEHILEARYFARECPSGVCGARGIIAGPHNKCWKCGTGTDYNRPTKAEARRAWQAQNQLFQSKVIKRCPGCKMETEKNGGCNHMTCSSCGQHWRWQDRSKMANGADYQRLRGIGGSIFRLGPLERNEADTGVSFREYVEANYPYGLIDDQARRPLLPRLLKKRKK